MKLQDINKIKKFRKVIMEFEKALSKTDGALKGIDECSTKNPVKSTFVGGCYVREIFMPKNQTITSQIHKKEHPYFILNGDITIISPDGINRIKGPHHGITKPGTKRVIITHEDTTFITVHATDKTTVEEVVEEVIAKDFDDPLVALPEPTNRKKIITNKKK